MGPPVTIPLGPETGTTIMAVAFEGGVVVGADSRVSTGTYISNRASDKITPLSDNVYLCRSGSAADTQLVSDYVRYFAHQASVERGEPPSVHAVAMLAMKIGYENKEKLMAAMICAGWDKRGGGQVYALPIGGTMVAVNHAIDGSGSTYIQGFVDAEFREGMSAAETEQFVTTALMLAMSRDGSSGGCIRLVTVDANGERRRFIPGNHVPVAADEMPEPRGIAV